MVNNDTPFGFSLAEACRLGFCFELQQYYLFTLDFGISTDKLATNIFVPICLIKWIRLT